ncbi:hypothetical protein GS486_18625 [Rhodococcus hoagii]|nr:hypothetical protein [Prescottella equi]
MWATATDLLGGAVVVDTPGAGGLDPAHAQLAARTAETACVLVWCVMRRPLTAPEWSSSAARARRWIPSWSR